MTDITEEQMKDARLHVEHADIVLTVCAYPPDTACDKVSMTGACSVGDDLPPFVLAQAAKLIGAYARDLAAEADRRCGMGHN